VSPLLKVDSGNLLFKSRKTQSKTKPDMLTAETIQQAYNTMGYDAVAVSESDLNAGKVFFEKSEKIKFPWISANIFDASGKMLFKPFIVKKIGEIRVGIIGLTGSGTPGNGSIVINGWEKSLRLQLPNLISRTDMIILLSNLTLSENSAIVKAFPEVDLIFTANKSQGNLPAYIAGNTLIAQTQSRGKYLGKLSLQYHLEKKWSGAPHLNPSTMQSLQGNIFKTNFIALKPRAGQSQVINIMVRKLKKEINKINRQ
jgi:2',3'-cyclic-nucleotide 2'-phosphodiesterase (5'-nucleotidase family)